ncbi:histone-fold-containing protein, partial [Macrolepiota fuliginosa MF-IS2]
MARTRPSNDPPALRAAEFDHRRAVKTTGSRVQLMQRPMVSGKTPAHLYQYTGHGMVGGKSYVPRPPRKPRKKVKGINAPPLFPKPVQRGRGALHEINHHQARTQPLIPKAPFERLVREVGQDAKEDVRFAPQAVRAIQEATEAWLVELFAEANLVAIHSRRVTIAPKDVLLVLRLR